jgi:hypothetical protein
LGLAGLPEFCQHQRLRAYWVNPRPLCGFRPSSRRNARPVNFGVLTLTPLGAREMRGLYPLSGFSSPSECHQCAPANPPKPNRSWVCWVLLPSEVSSPSAFCRPPGATYPGEIPTHPVKLRSQGFSPSQRFAPLVVCRACFIPVPLLGFTLRGFAPLLVSYVFPNAAPLLELVRASRNALPSFRVWFTRRIPPRDSVFSRIAPADAPLGFFPSGVSSLVAIAFPKENDHPLTRFTGWVAG